MTDTSNKQMVAIRGDRIIVMFPQQSMTKAEALSHAAWLVALADERDEFPSVLEEVQNS